MSQPRQGLVAAFTVRHRSGTTVDGSVAADGGVVVLYGPSGCGKTTVLRALAGLDRPATGRIAFDGVPWFDAAQGIDLPPQARDVGMLGQELVADVMEVSHKRHIHAQAVELFADMRHGRRRFIPIHRDAHDFRPRARQRRHLGNGALDIGGIGIGHGLHNDRCATPYCHRAFARADGDAHCFVPGSRLGWDEGSGVVGHLLHRVRTLARRLS
jgi:hypothetical protein